MGDVYSVFSRPFIGGIVYFFCWFCVFLLLARKNDIRNDIVEWMRNHKILSVVGLLLCLSVSVLSNRSFYRWIDCKDIRTMPEGEYCYYVKVNRELDDRVYTLPAKVEIARSSYTYTDSNGEERHRSKDSYYLRTVYFNNGGYLVTDDEFEAGEPIKFEDQDYEYWECTVTEQRCTPAPFAETSDINDTDTVRMTFCVLILVLTYLTLQNDIKEQRKNEAHLQRQLDKKVQLKEELQNSFQEFECAWQKRTDILEDFNEDLVWIIEGRDDDENTKLDADSRQDIEWWKSLKENTDTLYTREIISAKKKVEAVIKKISHL